MTIFESIMYWIGLVTSVGSVCIGVLAVLIGRRRPMRNGWE